MTVILHKLVPCCALSTLLPASCEGWENQNRQLYLIHKTAVEDGKLSNFISVYSDKFMSYTNL